MGDLIPDKLILAAIFIMVYAGFLTWLLGRMGSRVATAGQEHRNMWGARFTALSIEHREHLRRMDQQMHAGQERMEHLLVESRQAGETARLAREKSDREWKEFHERMRRDFEEQRVDRAEEREIRAQEREDRVQEREDRAEEREIRAEERQEMRRLFQELRQIHRDNQVLIRMLLERFGNGGKSGPNQA
ncbi:MAG: hypothetical protein KDK27_11700 [Leptospiraceae bacterium]|nr:hypothetical protein [Leptospiraceae bacterium]